MQHATKDSPSVRRSSLPMQVSLKLRCSCLAAPKEHRAGVFGIITNSNDVPEPLALEVIQMLRVLPAHVKYAHAWPRSLRMIPGFVPCFLSRTVSAIVNAAAFRPSAARRSSRYEGSALVSSSFLLRFLAIYAATLRKPRVTRQMRTRRSLAAGLEEFYRISRRVIQQDF